MGGWLGVGMDRWMGGWWKWVGVLGWLGRMGRLERLVEL